MIPYHIESDDGVYLSLSFANTDVERVRDYVASLPESTQTEIRTYSLDEDVHVLYTREPPAMRDAEATGQNDVTVQVLFNAFSGVETESEIAWNKSVDIEGIQQAHQRIEWRQTIGEVAAELFSHSVQAHGLPNGNHRSSLSLVGAYLQMYDCNLGEWLADSTIEHRPCVDDMFVESKRLLTLRRNARLFEWLYDNGCEGVVRKGGIEILFGESLFEWEQPFKELGRQHTERMYEALQEMDERHGDGQLSQRDKGKEKFRDCVAADENHTGRQFGKALSSMRD